MNLLLDNRQVFQWLVALQLLLLPALWAQLQPWLVAAALLALLVRAGQLWRGWRPPKPLWLALLALVATGLILLQAKGLGVLATLINLLWLGYSLKFLEARRDRDVELVLVVAFFLVALAFIFRQNIGWALYLCLPVVVAVAALMAAVAPATGQLWRQAGRMLLIALPLTLLLFVLLPRLAPMWRMPISDQARSGLAEDMAPGDISDLIKSAELAFRISFDGPPPAADERYFPVMKQERFDGRSWGLSFQVQQWRLLPQLTHAQPPPVAVADGPRYRVIAEPQRHRWAFAMAAPVPLDNQVVISPNTTLYRREDNLDRLNYSVATGSQVALATAAEREQNLRIPAAGNPQARQWAAKLAAQQGSGEAISAEILRTYSSEPYHYSLKPPLLGANSIDDFLYRSRSGFCGHYASATAFVLRAAGIPARIVTGYQGGEWNPQGNYLAVYQFDAHAWVEYVDSNGHWQRLDPTAAVAPERVENGATNAVDLADLPAINRLALARYRDWPLLSYARLWLANIDYQWTRRVLNYDSNQFWQQLALSWPSLRAHTAWLMLGSLMAVAALMAGLLLRPARRPLLFIWQPLRRYGQQLGLKEQPGESLSQYAERLLPLAAKPQLLRRIIWLYQHWRFAPLTAKQQQRHLRQLKRRLRQLKTAAR